MVSACVYPEHPEQLMAHLNAGEFNQRFPVGTKVRYWPFGLDARPEPVTAIAVEAYRTPSGVYCGVESRGFPVAIYKLEVVS